MPALPPFGWGSFVHHWDVRLAWLVVGALLIGGYLDAVIRGRQRGVRQPGWRVACFVAGVAVLLLTVSSAIDVYAMSLFWVHMVEHLLLIMVVPVLLVLGHPLSAVRGSLGDRGQARFDRLVRTGPIALITHPAIGLALYAAVIIGTHLTGFMDQMVTHSWLMTGEQVAYVVAGYLVVLPLLGREPVRWDVPYLPRIVLVLVAMVPDTVVGIVLLQSSKVSFPLMFSMHPSWAPDALSDQQIAGGLMWAAGDGLMMLIGIGVVIMMIADPQRKRVLGHWLESARSNTLDEHLVNSGGAVRADSGADVDDDESTLDAYNAMLARLSDQG
ncbi:MAG TPA: cytochrome c oxidase assembly protein [Marmoricola sp.]|nr:cytochrome c oxidase assembly protein [Marmoricola sp.]